MSEDDPILGEATYLGPDVIPLMFTHSFELAERLSRSTTHRLLAEVEDGRGGKHILTAKNHEISSGREPGAFLLEINSTGVLRVTGSALLKAISTIHQKSVVKNI